jgi:sulfide:quinone oxidoreductase
MSLRFRPFLRLAATPLLALTLHFYALPGHAQEKPLVIEPKLLDTQVMSAGQLSAADFPKLAAQGVKTIINNRPDNEEDGQISSAEAAALAKANGMRYVYIPMTYASLSREDVKQFGEVTKQAIGPVLAHCRSGARSSLLWALSQVADGKMTPDEALAATKKAGYNLDTQRPAFSEILGK